MPSTKHNVWYWALWRSPCRTWSCRQTPYFQSHFESWFLSRFSWNKNFKSNKKQRKTVTYCFLCLERSMRSINSSCKAFQIVMLSFWAIVFSSSYRNNCQIHILLSVKNGRIHCPLPAPSAKHHHGLASPSKATWWFILFPDLHIPKLDHADEWNIQYHAFIGN